MLIVDLGKHIGKPGFGRDTFGETDFLIEGQTTHTAKLASTPPPVDSLPFV